MTGNGQTDEEMTREPEQLVELPDPWLELQIYTDQTSEFPTVSQDSKKRYQPCVLYRGGENWLSRFAKGMEQT